MSLLRDFTELLKLIEVSGPFLSLPVAKGAFPQGWVADDVELARRLREAYTEYCDDPQGGRWTWLRFVLSQVLEYPEGRLAADNAIPQTLHARVAQHGETLRPDLALLDPRTGAARLLIQILPAGQDLEKALPGRIWKAMPGTRLMELLHATRCPLGLVTNGEMWMLVFAVPGESTGFATWRAELWLEERVTLRGFRSLLSAHRFFGVPDNETLEVLLRQSLENQQEVSNQLGAQVRRAVEVLVEALDRADREQGGRLLSGVPEPLMYEAALSVMMRLVFLFFTEERDLLPLNDPVYSQHYAISTLQEQLRESADQSTEEVLERRFDAWCRLLATFRAVHGGVEHDLFSLPAYGGHLFDPDRYPFLEGRESGTSWRETEARALPVHNRTVLHLLEALEFLEVRLPGGGTERRRLSFRALDVEQIGHVYEGLLDHTAVRAQEVVVSLAGPEEPEVALSRLEELRGLGLDALVRWVKDETGRSEATLRNLLNGQAEELDERPFVTACGNDAAVWQRLRPFARLVRRGSFGHPVVIPTGSVYVTAGTDRRTSGTQYTPRSLTGPIVRYTLEPVVYRGPAEGKPEEEWKLRPAAELLALKVCDPACGSGAFLAETCRYLAERLVEAWDEAERAQSDGTAVNITGDASTGDPWEVLLPKDAAERLALARRLVAQRCLYGVDKNPLAVEMAKLSLWLLTLDKNRPFTFLDHAIRCGDSLLGADLQQITVFSLDRRGKGVTYPLFLKDSLAQAADIRNTLSLINAATVDETRRQEFLLGNAEQITNRMRWMTDILVGSAFQPAPESWLQNKAAELAALLAVDDLESVQEMARQARGARRPFHWPVEFPEVFQGDGGFDAIVGNPPFMGGKKITGALSTEYRNYLVQYIGREKRGNADLCAYFFLRAVELVAADRGCGLLATNTIAQGDTREVGLDQILAKNVVVTRAVASRKWPGQANLEVAHIWLYKGAWNGEHSLEEKRVEGITSQLTVPGVVTGPPQRLAANAGKSFIGSYVLGMGFVLEPEEAQRLLDMDPRNQDVLFPYLNGEDLNSRPDQSPSRWVINFHDWPLERAREYSDCFEIVERLVKPERTRLDKDGEFVLRYPLYERWWHYADKRPALYAAIAGLERVMALCLVTHHVGLAFAPATWTFAHRLVVFPLPKFAHFAVLQSSLHEPWARAYSSSLETRLNYSPSDCFETFPFPLDAEGLEPVGQRYHEYRQLLMCDCNEGLTRTYNRFHDPQRQDDDIRRLQILHEEMDNAAAAAYGWSDLVLGHGYHETKQGTRYTITEAARREVLDRLLKLNHERHAAEIAAGDLRNPKLKRAGGKTPQTKQDTLF